MEMTPADYGAQAARQDVRQAIHLTEQTIQRDAHDRLLSAAERTMTLWIQHGLGDDENESEPVYMALEQAILDSRRVLGR